MRFTVPHALSRAQARARVEQLLAEARSKLSDKATIEEERWDGDTLYFAATVEGQRISGTVAVSDSQYGIEVKLPLMMRLFEGRIQKAIEEQIRAGLPAQK